MDTRIGYPSEHLAGDTESSETSPMYATAVGLLMNALELNGAEVHEEPQAVENEVESLKKEGLKLEENKISSSRSTILERWVEKFKIFLDNA